MANQVALVAIRDNFEKKLLSARDLFTVAEPIATSPPAASGMTPAQARQVIGLAFLQMSQAFEDLVDSSFVRYLAGAQAPSGYKPALRTGPAAGLQHAYQILSGDPSHKATKHYLTWTNWTNACDLASVFFEQGKPFTLPTNSQRQRFADAVTIRNRVAHMSQKCRTDFKKVALEHLGKPKDGQLFQGFNVGHLLTARSTRLFGPGAKLQPFFLHYYDLFEALSGHVCPK
jgi:hypothetical protein